jgi:hypothetical protein
VYRRILGPVYSYENEKENWRILTNKETYAMVKRTTITETIRLNRLRWFGHVQRMEENRIPKKVSDMKLLRMTRNRRILHMPMERMRRTGGQYHIFFLSSLPEAPYWLQHTFRGRTSGYFLRVFQTTVFLSLVIAALLILLRISASVS